MTQKDRRLQVLLAAKAAAHLDDFISPELRRAAEQISEDIDIAICSMGGDPEDPYWNNRDIRAIFEWARRLEYMKESSDILPMRVMHHVLPELNQKVQDNIVLTDEEKYWRDVIWRAWYYGNVSRYCQLNHNSNNLESTGETFRRKLYRWWNHLEERGIYVPPKR